MNGLIFKNKLEELAQKYETQDFIKDDPIQFPHRFMPIGHCETWINSSYNECSPEQSPLNLQNVEIAAFLASLFAYGNRKVFIKKLDELFEIMQNNPLEFILNFDAKTLKGFNYRFAKDFDVIEIFKILNKLYKDGKSIKSLFEYGYGLDNSTSTMLQTVTDYFYSNAEGKVGQGFYHLVPNPKNKGAMKRMNMFLRWMVRKGPVDLGIWDFVPTSELLIPLDVHVARISREMGLLNRSSNDFKAVVELSENLKKFDPQDPTKYDFAMFGLGVNSNVLPLAEDGINKHTPYAYSSPLAGEDEFQHELESARNSGEGYKKAHLNYAPYMKNFAREMRKNLTSQERKLWLALKNSNLGFKFRRQFNVDNKYIADFICFEKRLIIEIDGGQHNQSFADVIRNFYLKKENFRIIRFWNNEIDNNFDGCIKFLTNELNTPHPVF